MRLVLLLGLAAAGCAEYHGLPGDALLRDGGTDAALETCGVVTCAVGTVCCNASCGICVPPGGSCIALDCADAGPIEPCRAQDARGEGPCEAELGVMWTGYGCRTISGCSCAGTDCGELYDSDGACVAAHPGCPRHCGGWGGETCLAGEYCDYPDGSFCGGDDSQGVCRRPADVCADPGGVPVCGCDGRDHLTECSAAMVGVDVLHYGACDAPAPSFRALRVFDECDADGASTHIELAETIGDCDDRLRTYIDLEFPLTHEVSSPTTYDLDTRPTTLMRASICSEGRDRPVCAPLSGRFTIEALFRAEIAIVSYDLRSPVDGSRFAGATSARAQFCPPRGPGCR